MKDKEVRKRIHKEIRNQDIKGFLEEPAYKEMIRSEEIKDMILKETMDFVEDEFSKCDKWSLYRDRFEKDLQKAIERQLSHVNLVTDEEALGEQIYDTVAETIEVVLGTMAEKREDLSWTERQ